MSHTPPGEDDETIWGVLAIAAAVRRLSQYPLVVLTNGTSFADGTSYADAFRKLGVQVLPVHAIDPPGKLGSTFRYPRFVYAYWKIQIWRLTQFDKLLWLDSDAILYRGVDWIFQRDGMWAQANDFGCMRFPTVPCTGAFSFEPSEEDYENMVAFASNLSSIPEADQTLVPQYFTQVKGKPIKFLRFVEADFGQCLTRVPSAFRDDAGREFTGLWSVPAIVHKSGGDGDHENLCFSPKLARQLYTVGNTTINVCNYNPLGVHWRELFCEAAHRELGLKVAEVLSFCSDACWYGGAERRPAEAQLWGGDVPCTPSTNTDPVAGRMHMMAYPAALGPQVG